MLDEAFKAFEAIVASSFGLIVPAPKVKKKEAR